MLMTRIGQLFIVATFYTVNVIYRGVFCPNPYLATFFSIKYHGMSVMRHFVKISGDRIECSENELI